jgi:pilus assembly protein CpaE
VPSSSILLLDTDADATQLITDTLTGAGYSVTAVTDPDEAFRQAHDNHLVILDVVAGGRSAADVCKEIRSTPALAAIAVLCISQTDDVEERISFLTAGADDVMAKPFDARELEARVEALLLRFQRTNLPATTFGEGGAGGAQLGKRIVAVFSPKGGVGTTTIAVNLGLAQALKEPDKVCIIDLDLQFGQVATHLNLEARQTLIDVVRDDAALREAELLRTYASRHDTGVHVLAAPASPETSDLVTAEHITKILTIINETYDTVIVDAGSDLDERTMTVFEHASTVVLPVYPEIAALKAVHSLLDYLTDTGSVGAKALFVLNNIFAKEILRLRDVESALGTKISADLPYDPFLYLKAVNEGIPVIRGAPRTPAAEKLLRLATVVFGAGAGATALPVGVGGDGAAPAREEKKGGLFGGLRRR